MKMFNFFKKTSEPKPKPKPKPIKVKVFMHDGAVNVHHAAYRAITNDGILSLFDESGGGQVVADYAHGHWKYFVVGDDK